MDPLAGRVFETALLYGTLHELIHWFIHVYFQYRPKINFSWVFNWPTKTLLSKGNLTMPRYGHSCFILPDGRVVAAGGSPSGFGGVDTDSMEIYDKASGTWSESQYKLPYTSIGGSTLSLDGVPYYFGG